MTSFNKIEYITLALSTGVFALQIVEMALNGVTVDGVIIVCWVVSYVLALASAANYRARYEYWRAISVEGYKVKRQE